MEEILYILRSAGIFIAALTVLVFVHELGHFMPAKWFKMRVDKFFIFFDWPRKIFSWRKGETEYGVGVLPLGGYVKIAGMIDESLDTDKASAPPEPWEFRAKPVWQRMIVMVGGVTMNVILAILIYTVSYTVYGERKIPLDNELHNTYGIYVPDNAPGKDLGFKTGDKIVSVNGHKPLYFDDVSSLRVLYEDSVRFTVERNGVKETIHVPNDYIDALSDKDKDSTYPALFAAGIPSEIKVFTEEEAVENLKNKGRKKAWKAYEQSVSRNYRNEAGEKMLSGDRVIAIGGDRIAYFQEMSDALARHKNKEVEIIALRGADTLIFTPKLDSTGKLFVIPNHEPETVAKEYNFLTAIPRGTEKACNTLALQIKGIGKVIRGYVSVRKSVAGPIKIAGFMTESYDAGGFAVLAGLIGMLSMWLAFVNILPIPALDGGHLMLLTIEAIKGKPLSTQAVIRVQQIGMIILLLLMVFIVFNDLF